MQYEAYKLQRFFAMKKNRHIRLHLSLEAQDQLVNCWSAARHRRGHAEVPADQFQTLAAQHPQHGLLFPLRRHAPRARRGGPAVASMTGASEGEPARSTPNDADPPVPILRSAKADVFNSARVRRCASCR